MLRLEMKSYNLILTEKQQKYQHYHLEKSINMNIEKVKKYFSLIKDKQQNKASLYILLQKNVRKTNKKTGQCFKVLKPSNKKDEIKKN